MKLNEQQRAIVDINFCIGLGAVVFFTSIAAITFAVLVIKSGAVAIACS